VKIRYKIWLEKEGQVVFGKGREELLKAVEDCRSLNAAAKKMKMSYRAAWARLKASEQRAGIKLVESDGLGKGLHLTPEARELLRRFTALENETRALMETSRSQFTLQKIKPRKTKN